MAAHRHHFMMHVRKLGNAKLMWQITHLKTGHVTQLRREGPIEAVARGVQGQQAVEHVAAGGECAAETVVGQGYALEVGHERHRLGK